MGECAIDIPEAEEVREEALPSPSQQNTVYDFEESENQGTTVEELRIRAMNDADCEICNRDMSPPFYWLERVSISDRATAHSKQYSRCIGHYTMRSFAILTLLLMNGLPLFLSASFFLSLQPSENLLSAIKGTSTITNDTVVAGGTAWRSISLLSMFTTICNAVWCLAQFEPEAGRLVRLICAELGLGFFAWLAWVLDPKAFVGEEWSRDEWLSSLLNTSSIMDGVLLATIVIAMLIRGGKRALIRQADSLQTTVRTKPLATGILVAYLGLGSAGIYLHFR